MSTKERQQQEKHNLIREVLASLGYHVRREGQFALAIVPVVAERKAVA